MISVIIPAHNEAAVIGRCLSALTAGAAPNELEIIVVCNGCTDDTARIAQAYGAKVLETPVRSKSHAINLGDKHAIGFPRVYLDADVCLPLESLRIIAREADSKGLAFAMPVAEVNFGDSPSWFVRSFYAVWLKLPCCSRGLVGSGVYVLSKEGRIRFRDFPNLICDDGFVRLHFRLEEQHVVKGAKAYVYPPRSLNGLIRAHSRSQRGNWQLRERYPELWKRNKESNLSALLKLATYPLYWPSLVIYVIVKTLARLRGFWQDASGIDQWEMDDSRQVGRT